MMRDVIRNIAVSSARHFNKQQTTKTNEAIRALVYFVSYLAFSRGYAI